MGIFEATTFAVMHFLIDLLVLFVGLRLFDFRTSTAEAESKSTVSMVVDFQAVVFKLEVGLELSTDSSKGKVKSTQSQVRSASVKSISPAESTSSQISMVALVLQEG